MKPLDKLISIAIQYNIHYTFRILESVYTYGYYLSYKTCILNNLINMINKKKRIFININ